MNRTNSATTTEFDMMSTYNSIRRVGSPHNEIGRPITFVSGQFEGRSIRTEITELQKADLGRKYARKDRRPLDPPPVVQLKLYEVFNAGTPRESQQELDCYDDVQGFGLICHVDLFPVPPQDDPTPSQTDGRKPRQPRQRARLNNERPPPVLTAPTISPISPVGSPTSMLSASPNQQQFFTFSASPQQAYPPRQRLHSIPTDPYSIPPLTVPSPGVAPTSTSPYVNMPSEGLPLPPMQVPDIASSPFSFHPYPQALNGIHASGSTMPPPPDPEVQSDIVAYLGDYPITESSKCTEALVGASFCQSATLDYKGKKVLMFVFSDLAVRIEGTFILRYRVFNIFSRAQGTHDIPILAEYYGGPFKIYSTKEFPGLRASTDLTKHLSFFGVRLNLRENERKRRKKTVTSTSGNGAASSNLGQGRRRKKPARKDDDYGDDLSDDNNSSEEED